MSEDDAMVGTVVGAVVGAQDVAQDEAEMGAKDADRSSRGASSPEHFGYRQFLDQKLLLPKLSTS